MCLRFLVHLFMKCQDPNHPRCSGKDVHPSKCESKDIEAGRRTARTSTHGALASKNMLEREMHSLAEC